MATDTQKCTNCGKELTGEEMDILSDVLAGLNRHRIERHNEIMASLGLPPSPLTPPRDLLPIYEQCAACYTNNTAMDEVGKIMDQIIEMPWLHPGVFRFEEVEGPRGAA